MKKTVWFFPVALFFAAALALTACGNNAGEAGRSETSAEPAEMMDEHHHHGAAADHAHGDGPEYTAAYVCPMHCEGSGSDEPGECPVCGMDYVALSDHLENGHRHE